MIEYILIGCLYVIAGGILAGIMDFEDNDELGLIFVVAWPGFMTFALFVASVKLLIRVGNAIRNWWIKLFKR